MQKLDLYFISVILLFITLLAGMNYYEKQTNKVKSDIAYTSVFDSISNMIDSLNNSPDYLISLIESSKQIEGRYVGFVARKSFVYNNYEKLLELISDSLWVELSYSNSPVMRYYACEALLSNGSDNLPLVKKRLIKDTTPVCYQSMDVILCRPLGELIKYHF